MSNIDLITKSSKVRNFHNNQVYSYESSFEKGHKCVFQSLHMNGHSIPIKDFWGVVVECKVMPGSFIP